MKKSKLPKTDSIDKLAKFWDRHDVTDFESELEEVTEPIFVRRPSIHVHLDPQETAAVKKMAHAKGVSQEELVRGWVLQKLGQRNRSAKKKRRATARVPRT